MTFTPSKHWGARTLHDSHRGYGGFVLEHQGRKIYHAGDSAYFDGFKEIGRKLAPEIALLPIGAYHPETFRRVHMGPDEAMKAFKDLRREMFCADALRHVQAVVRGFGRAAALAAGNRARKKI